MCHSLEKCITIWGITSCTHQFKLVYGHIEINEHISKANCAHHASQLFYKLNVIQLHT